MVQAGLAKAEEEDLDPLDDDDFVIILGLLAARLSEETEKQDAKALRDALDHLDVNWALLSAAAVARILAGAEAIMEGSVEKIIPRTSPVFAAAARAIAPASKKQVIDRDKLAIAAALTLADKKTGAALLRQQGLFIRDEYGRRATGAMERVQAIVSEGVARNATQDQITAMLAEDLTLMQLARTRAYWDVVGTQFANRLRTSIQLNAYEQAGVLRYRFIAVIDHRTTDMCRFLHKRVFSVKAALRHQRRAEEMSDADALRDAMPWVSRQKGPDGRVGLFYQRGGIQHRVAYIENGEFVDGLSDEQLQAAGVAVPPLHVRCRSTIVRES